jgi:hypothetical protein
LVPTMPLFFYKQAISHLEVLKPIREFINETN